MPHPDLAQLTICAKVALKQLNAYTIPSPAEWAVSNPQGAEELGSDRIDTLTRYKACALLAGQVVSAGGKVTKLLGRKFLLSTQAWGAVAPGIAAELTTLGIPPALVTRFMDGFSGTLEDNGEDLASLVWSSDFQGELRARQQARLREVSERRERMQGNEDEATMLREALVDGEEDETERIVELGVS